MADKFFIATCEKKVSKHPVKDGKSFTLPVKAGTQQEAKDIVRAEIEKLDPEFEGKSVTYNDWYKVPNLVKATEEEYNKAMLEQESSLPEPSDLTDGEDLATENDKAKYPQLGDDGFFNSKDPQVIESSFIYSSTDEHMQAAKVFVLNVGAHKWAFGFRYKNGEFDHHEKMNLDNVVENKENAVDSAVNRLESFCDIRDEFGVEDAERPFLSAVMSHDFYYDFSEPSELFIDAISKHPDIEYALDNNDGYYEVVDGHFADVWPIGKSPQQVIEHVMSMQSISILYDLEAFTEIMKAYLPMELSEKTKQSMERIEEVIDKPAANDGLLADKCWKAALPITDDFHVVLAIKDCGDEGWLTAFEGSLKQERVFGDADDFGDVHSSTRKEAIKFAAGQATNALYNYDSTMSLAKVFMKSPYIQNFEDNCMELGVSSSDSADVEYPTILNAIIERLNKRVTIPTQSEIDSCYATVSQFITEKTNLEVLVFSILDLKQCKSLFTDEEAQKLVERCENVEIDVVDYPLVLDAIRERLTNESHTVTPERAYTQMSKLITETTDTTGLAEAIKALKNPVIIWHSTESVNLVMKFTSDKKAQPEQKQEDKKEVVNDEPKTATGSEETATENSTSKSDDDGSTADSGGSDDDGEHAEPDLTQDEPEPEPIPTIEYDKETKQRRVIWDQVCTTQKRFTKPVEYGDRKYTAVDIDHQIEQATNMWGCYGETWGLTDIEETERGCLISAKTKFFYPSPTTGERISFPLHNSIAFKRVYTSKNGPYESYDDDYFKKLESNFLSRAFAKLGWNADVRQGKFEDAHYMFVGSLQDQAQQKLEQMERENEAFDGAMNKAQVIVDKFNTAKSLAEMKRFKEQALTHLTAIPASNDDIKRKLDTANAKIENKFQEASKQYVDDMAATGENANG
ncbi:hypothetical protein ACP6H7_00895 [Vibrio harveyi]|uniref:hypothetical protein n=1 Tax=Vibrio harveyi TaxID=669 RepID=UPI003CEEA027